MKITKGRCTGQWSSDFLGRGLRGNLGRPTLPPPIPAPRKSQLRQVRELMPFPACFAPDGAPPVPHSGLTPGMPPRASPWSQALSTSPAPILSPKCLYRPPPTPQSPLEPSWCLQPPSYQPAPSPLRTQLPPSTPSVSPSQHVRSPLAGKRSNLRLKSRELNLISTDGSDGKINTMPFEHP